MACSSSALPYIRHADFLRCCSPFWAHGCRYYSLCFSGDAMLLTQQGQAVYQSTLGRYLQPVYWLLRGEITVPPVIGLFATVFLFPFVRTDGRAFPA